MFGFSGLVKATPALIRDHYRSLTADLDVASDSTGFHRRNPHYLYALIVFTLSMVYGTFGLILESDPEIEFTNLRKISTSPYLFYHIIIPPVLWPFVDLCFLVAIPFVCGTLNNVLYFNEPINERHRIQTTNPKCKSSLSLRKTHFIPKTPSLFFI